MGVEPFLISSSVEGILAQRLVRRICKECVKDFTADPADLPESFALPAGTSLRKGTGCRACRNTGYRGRLGVYELMRISDDLRHLITERAPGPAIAAKAKSEGNLATLLEDGYTKVRAGSTTLEEVLSAVSV